MMIFRLTLLAFLGAILPAAAPSPAFQTSTAPTPQSQPDTRAAADQAYAQAMQLYAQKTPESLRKGIAKSEEALALYQQVGDRAKQAELLVIIGSASLTVGDKSRAAEYLHRGLDLVRSGGNRAEEAVVVGMLGSAYESNQEFKPAQDSYQQALALCRESKNSQLLRGSGAAAA